MAIIKGTSAKRVLGDPSRKPCCLVNGDTVDIGEPRTGEVCVDLGSGLGNSAIKLADAVKDKGFVYAVETSKEILRRSRRRIEAVGVKNVGFIHSIFEDIAIGDSLVDLVVSNCSLARAQEKRRIWKEIRRMLKPGGRFVVSDVFSDRPMPRMRRGREQSDSCLADLKTKEEYLITLDGLGFVNITIIEESVPYPAVHLGQPISISSLIVAGHRPLRGCRDEAWQ